jgi:hypothetical protein
MYPISNYQKTLNSKLTGAMGPTNSAYWPKLMSTSGKPYSLKSTPLVFSPQTSNYITAFSTPNQAQASLSFSYGKPARRAYFPKNGRKTTEPMRFGELLNVGPDDGDLDFGNGFGRSKYKSRRKRKSKSRRGRKSKSRRGRKGRKYKSRRKRKGSKSKSRRKRKSPWEKGWKAPTKVTSRRRMLKKCGSKCFYIPNPKNPKFPICNADCTVNLKGLESAYIRARQWGYDDIARKAKKKLKSMGK